ncbi:MAG TPA: LysR family transcriptional regulator [Cellulomonas sp.]
MDLDLDLHKLRSFVCVAERLSFVQAAAELHLTQPALTRQVQSLEHELGVPLLLRDRRGTALTGPGRQLLEDGRALLDSAAGVQRRVRAAARGATEFTIGFMPGVPSTGIVRAFAAVAPQVLLDVVAVPMDEQEPYLHDGRVDVSFVRLPVRSRSVRTIALFDEPRVAVLPATSPLAPAGRAGLDALATLPLIDDPGTLPGWRGDALPRRRPLVGVDERLEAVAAGDGFTVLPAGIARYHHRDDVRLVELIDVAPVVVALGYLRHRTMPEIEQLADLARAQLSGGAAPAEGTARPAR